MSCAQVSLFSSSFQLCLFLSVNVRSIWVEVDFIPCTNLFAICWHGVVHSPDIFKKIIRAPSVALRVVWIRVCPSVRSSFQQLSWGFFFLKLWKVLWDPYGDVRDRAHFFLEKSTSGCFFFNFLRKIYSLVLSGDGIKWKYLWPYNMRKPHLWEKSGSQVMAKNALGQSDFSFL